VRYRGRATIQQCFARLARDLVRILDERTAMAMSFAPICGCDRTPPRRRRQFHKAALNYYESAGQNWERAALIKARPWPAIVPRRPLSC